MTALDLRLGEAKFGSAPVIRWDDHYGVRHVLVVGTTGAGKSSWLNGAIAAVAASPLVQVVGFDPKALELSHWAGRLSALAVTAGQGETAVADLHAILDGRGVIGAARGWKTWNPSPAEPWILVVVDELAQAMQVPLIGELIDRVLHVGRALGVAVAGATQQPSAKVFGGTELRSLFTCRAALFDPEAEGYRMCFGKAALTEHGAVLRYLRQDRPGLAAWTDGTRAPTLARGWRWTVEDVAEAVERTYHLTRRLAELVPEGATTP